MKQEELNKILESHEAWLCGKKEGIKANLSRADLYDLSRANLSRADLYDLSRANLSRADLYDLSNADLSNTDLSRADLSGANLYRANLSRANLSRANFSNADLSRANLSRANLSGANLSCSNLSGANLSGANLSGTDLSGANLYGVNLSCSNLSGVNLSGADLSGVNLNDLQKAQLSIVPSEGQFIGWKKCCNNVLVKLLIPENAQRSNATGRKCRAEFVDVLEVIGAEFGIANHDKKTEYRKGKRVVPDGWTEDRWKECGQGIHFFITKEEAENYTF